MHSPTPPLIVHTEQQEGIATAPTPPAFLAGSERRLSMEKMQQTLEQKLVTKIFGKNKHAYLVSEPSTPPKLISPASPPATTPLAGHKLDDELLQKIAKVRAAAEGAALEREREQVSPPSPVAHTGASPPRKQHHAKVVDEILRTERTYVADLHALCALEACWPSGEELAVVHPLLRVHEELLERLEHAGESEGASYDLGALGAAFGTLAPFLRCVVSTSVRRSVGLYHTRWWGYV